MTKGELLDKLEEFELRVNEIVSLLEGAMYDCEDFYYYMQELRKEVEADDDEW